MLLEKKHKRVGKLAKEVERPFTQDALVGRIGTGVVYHALEQRV